MRGDVSATWAQMVPQIGRALPRADAVRVTANLRYADELLKSVDSSRLERVDDMLRDLADKAAKDGDSAVRDIYREARNVFRQALPDDVNEALSMLDGLYARYSILQRAATSKRSLASGGVFTPDDLMNAVRVRNSPKSLARGDARLQSEAAQALEVFDGLTGRVGKLDRIITGAITAPAAPVLALSQFGLNDFSRRLLTGRYRNSPAALARELRRLSDRGVTTRTAGAALSTTDNEE